MHLYRLCQTPLSGVMMYETKEQGKPIMFVYLSLYEG